MHTSMVSVVLGQPTIDLLNLILHLPCATFSHYFYEGVHCMPLNLYCQLMLVHSSTVSPDIVMYRAWNI